MGDKSLAVESPGTELVPGSALVYVGLDLGGDGLIKLPFLRNAFLSAKIPWLAARGKSVYAHGMARSGGESRLFGGGS